MSNQINYTVDQDRVRWPGSGSAITTGSCPFGFFELDSIFAADGQAAAKWAATRLGYPITDVEMLDTNFYACFEEACFEYSAQVNQFNIRNNIGVLQGTTTNINLTQTNVVGSGLPYMIKIAQGYGTEFGVGGLVDWKSGSIDLKEGKQHYDLQALWGNVSESFNRIEIRRIFHGPSPASARIYDPFSMTGMSYSNILNEMGFAGYSPATQFLMTPIFEDLLRMQAIEFNDLVRKSGYSFELINNKLSIFPIPTYDFKLHFEYLLGTERDAQGISPSGSYYSGSQAIGSNTIGDYSNVPYNVIPYSTVNSVGKQWIRKYFLALCKEVLGAIRQKYQSIPIPGAEVTLDGGELRQEASAEKEILITQLRENLEASGRKAQMEMRAAEAEQMQQTLQRVPLGIYIG
jgi:hypothetical protein